MLSNHVPTSFPGLSLFFPQGRKREDPGKEVDYDHDGSDDDQTTIVIKDYYKEVWVFIAMQTKLIICNIMLDYASIQVILCSQNTLQVQESTYLLLV